ncbi:uncharacterized protein LOC119981881 [Tripterygium wilfordii]|uniref:uncharacterized protein LOC119981881 n=1 Tax=Tripterygium wilfordii TaxID=458696 RepID=UPI0018F83466|nr:uncharacterized protein LOC119981881 [Tripterygium wilfordii]
MGIQRDARHFQGVGRTSVANQIKLKLHKQPSRRMSNEVALVVKDELDRLLKIFIAAEDTPKTTFLCPCTLGAFECVVIPFGLKNVGVKYQKAMNSIFQDMLGRTMEIYIRDTVTPIEARNLLGFLIHQRGIEAVKGHALADFLANYPCLTIEEIKSAELRTFFMSYTPWTLLFYGFITNFI